MTARPIASALIILSKQDTLISSGGQWIEGKRTVNKEFVSKLLSVLSENGSSVQSGGTTGTELRSRVFTISDKYLSKQLSHDRPFSSCMYPLL